MRVFRYEEGCTEAIGIVRTELARFPVRALTAMFTVFFLLNID